MEVQELIYQIALALLGGGLAGHLTGTYLTSSLTARRDAQNWLRSEKYRLYCELLEITSAVVTREEEGDYTTWPDKIRVLSQKVHLLYPGGHAPAEIGDTLEKLFQLALKKKLGRVKDDKKWRHEMRDEARKLREAFADTLLS